MNTLPQNFPSDIIAYFKIQDVKVLCNFPDDFQGQASMNLVVSLASPILSTVPIAFSIGPRGNTKSSQCLILKVVTQSTTQHAYMLPSLAAC